MDNKKLITYLQKSFMSGNLKTMLTVITTGIFLPLIIRKIGMDTYGIISLSTIIGGLFGTIDLGINKAVTVLIGKSNKKDAGIIFANGLVIIGSLFFIVSLLLLLLTNNLNIFGNQVDISKSLENYIVLISLLSFGIILLNNIIGATLQAYYLNHYTDIGYAIFSTIFYLAIYTISFFTESLYLLIGSSLIAYTVTALYLILVLKKKTSFQIKKPNLNTIKLMIRMSYQFFNIGMTYAFIQPINKYIFLALTGNTALLGVLDIGLKIGNLANSLLNSLTQPLLGIFSSIQFRKETITRIANRVSLMVLVQYILGTILFYFIGERITSYLSQEYGTQLYTISLIFIMGIGSNAISEPYFKVFVSNENFLVAFLCKLFIPLSNIIFFIIFYQMAFLERIVISFSLASLSSNLVIISYYFWSKSGK